MKKVSISIIALLIMAISVCQVTFAADGEESVSLDLQSSIDLEKKEVTVILSLGEYKNLSESAIIACQANLSYDKNIFESVKIEGLNKWNADYVEATGNVIIETASGATVSSNQQIAKLTFELKDGVEEANTKIIFKKIKLTVDAEKNFKNFGELTANIKISIKTQDNNKKNNMESNDGKDESNNESKNDVPNQNIEPNKNESQEKEDKNNTNLETNTNTQTTINTAINNVKQVYKANNDSSTTAKTLPKTGIFKVATILIAIAIIGIACLIRYKSIEIK